MTRNVGSIDRIVRIVAGAALVGWALFGQGEYHLWGFLGVVPLATGLTGWCPAYLPFGISTCRTQSA